MHFRHGEPLASHDIPDVFGFPVRPINVHIVRMFTAHAVHDVLTGVYEVMEGSSSMTDSHASSRTHDARMRAACVSALRPR